MDTLGAVLGSLLAFLLLFLSWTYSQIIFFTIFPGIIAVILVFFVKEAESEKKNDPPKAKRF